MPNKKVRIGDYCHAHRWADKDPNDPYAVGFLAEIIINASGPHYRLEGDGVPPGYFRHCERITKAQGKKLLARQELESALRPAAQGCEIKSADIDGVLMLGANGTYAAIIDGKVVSGQLKSAEKEAKPAEKEDKP